MARPLRIQFQNAWYHVMNRGTDRGSTFSEDSHYKLFLTVLEESTSRFGIEIHSYCLMNNHYHLLVKTPLANLSRAMRHIDGVYTLRYNRLMQRDGPLFRGRYKSIVIDAENYLIAVSRYIHRNPVEANICKSVGDYKWSSYAAYIGEVIKPEWLFVQELLRRTSQDIYSFREVTEVPLAPSLPEYDLKRESLPPIWGTKDFCEGSIEKVSHLCNHPEIPQARLYKRKPSLSLIIESAASAFVKTRNKGDGRKNYARSAAIFLGCRKYGHTLNCLAKTFGISYSGVSITARRFHELMQKDERVRDVVNDIAGQIDKLSNVKT